MSSLPKTLKRFRSTESKYAFPSHLLPCPGPAGSLGVQRTSFSPGRLQVHLRLSLSRPNTTQGFHWAPSPGKVRQEPVCWEETARASVSDDSPLVTNIHGEDSLARGFQHPLHRFESPGGCVPDPPLSRDTDPAQVTWELLALGPPMTPHTESGGLHFKTPPRGTNEGKNENTLALQSQGSPQP